MLFGERRFLLHRGGLGKSRRPDRVGSLMGPLQIARKPDGISRQDFGDRLEHLAITGIAAEVLLPINAAAVLAHRRVTHPPPPRRDYAFGNGVLQNEWFVCIGHLENPSILFA